MSLGDALSRNHEARARPAICVPELSGIPRDRLAGMAAAGEEVVDCMRVLAKTEDNVVGEALRDGGVFYELTHYPDGDIHDSASHAQFYYHAHRPGEHGHFHTFLRKDGMPEGVAPASLPADHPVDEGDEDDVICHLIGFSMDKYGVPIGLFTTNLWLTGDTWYAAEDVCRMIDLFDIDLARPSWALNRWISTMFPLFRPQMIALLHDRDEKIAAWAAQHPGVDVYEDRNLDIVSYIPISIDDQRAAVTRALAESA